MKPKMFEVTVARKVRGRHAPMWTRPILNFVVYADRIQEARSWSVNAYRNHYPLAFAFWVRCWEVSP